MLVHHDVQQRGQPVPAQHAIDPGESFVGKVVGVMADLMEDQRLQQLLPLRPFEHDGVDEDAGRLAVADRMSVP
jgi:hypothetical protein